MNTKDTSALAPIYVCMHAKKCDFICHIIQLHVVVTPTTVARDLLHGGLLPGPLAHEDLWMAMLAICSGCSIYT